MEKKNKMRFSDCEFISLCSCFTLPENNLPKVHIEVLTYVNFTAILKETTLNCNENSDWYLLKNQRLVIRGFLTFQLRQTFFTFSNQHVAAKNHTDKSAINFTK